MERTAFGLHLLILATDITSAHEEWNFPLQAVELGQLVAVGRWFSAEELKALEAMSDNLEWISKQAIAHDQVIKSVAKYGAVLPFKLGSLFSSEEVLRQKLEQHQEAFVAQLKQLKGKQEWSVKLYGDYQDLAAGQGVNEELESLKKLIAQSSPGRAFLLKKKAAKQESQAKLKQAEEAINGFCQELNHYALKLETKDAISKKITEREEDMLLNTAVLIDRDTLPQWESWLQKQRKHWQDRNIELAVSGPWPPYHFTQNVMA